MRGKTAVEIKFRFKKLITEKIPKKMITAGRKSNVVFLNTENNSAKEELIIYYAYIENKNVLPFT